MISLRPSVYQVELDIYISRQHNSVFVSDILL